jgi:pyrimidine-nucleoside phosphorylase
VRAVDIIIKKRQGRELSAAEIEFLIRGCVSGEVPDYQMSAFLMAVYFKGMNSRETGLLTGAMLDSGERLDLTGLRGPFIDKHSTGGVGDKLSLVLAPIAAACGLTVPMMCGRGLGHTGGTIDKLESIPGYDTALGPKQVRDILSDAGFVIMSQTESMAPADKKLYALRDVTGTVESVPLITASILSKKCACGAEGFVFDVKTGSGAFMKDLSQARTLARSLVNTALSLGKKAVAVITDMNTPLGNMVGNLLEVGEAVASLRGDGPRDVTDLSLRLAARMLVLGGVCREVKQAERLARRSISDGSALKRFLRNIELQGGDPDFASHLAELRPSSRKTPPPVKIPLPAWADGFVTGCDAYKVGLAAVVIGAGRSRKEDSVLPGVGIELCAKPGKKVKKGEPLLYIYIQEEKGKAEALELLTNAYAIGPRAPDKVPLVMDEII